MYRKGDVVLVPFPFRDSTTTKVRPAVIVSEETYNQHGDLIIAAITAHPPRFPTDYQMIDWQTANLVAPSVVRIQLATISESRVVHSIGEFSSVDLHEVEVRLRQVLGL
jgi:mRNA interferase MazF